MPLSPFISARIKVASNRPLGHQAGTVARFAAMRRATSTLRPEIRQDHPLNLSISISGGKETNQDSPSNGE
jgi:hypothetical protein